MLKSGNHTEFSVESFDRTQYFLCVLPLHVVTVVNNAGARKSASVGSLEKITHRPMDVNWDYVNIWNAGQMLISRNSKTLEILPPLPSYGIPTFSTFVRF